MAVSRDLGGDRRLGLMKVVIMGWMRVVDTISLRGRGGREEDRSGRIGGGEGRGLVMGRRIAGRSDFIERRGIVRGSMRAAQALESVTIDR